MVKETLDKLIEDMQYNYCNHTYELKKDLRDINFITDAIESLYLIEEPYKFFIFFKVLDEEYRLGSADIRHRIVNSLIALNKNLDSPRSHLEGHVILAIQIYSRNLTSVYAVPTWTCVTKNSQEQCQKAEKWIYRGVILPDRYHKPIEQWKAKWILSEPNAELRRLLIQGIGYEKIEKQLKSKVLDTWREYSLLKITERFNNHTGAGGAVIRPFEADEFIYLLKMVCPSTGHTHILKVPPEMTTAKEAITWANHGIAPEEFAIET